MKTNILFLTLITATTCAPLCASDKQPSRLAAARARLHAARHQTAPEVPHSERQDTAPTLQDVIAVVDDEAEFNKRLRAHLDGNPGCKTWDESCESSCPTWDKATSWNTAVSELPGFDQPITCKSYLGSCYQSLRGCSQDGLNEQFKHALNEDFYKNSYLRARFKTIALICQGANPNISGNYDLTALHYAAFFNDFHLVQFLLKHHPNMNAKTIGGLTPLMDLAYKCENSGTSSNTDIALLFLNAGAEMHHRIKEGYIFKGKTALEIARSKQEHAPCKALADFLETYEKQPNRVME